MKSNIYLVLILTFLAIALDNNEAKAQHNAYALSDFYRYDARLADDTDSIFDSLSEQQRVAQMIITSAGELGKSDKEVMTLLENDRIGGVVFLKGTKAAHKELIDSLNAISLMKGTLPLINSMDAEPSLFNGRVKGTEPMMTTIDIRTVHQCDSVVKVIDSTLPQLGIHQNFAPVCDLSPGNEAIRDRSFGSDRDTVILLSRQFIETSQDDGIVATAKHFPGHGLVKGDTHEQSVHIDGDLQELEVYGPLIDTGVISVMVAHITVDNNEDYGTDGLPATCSRTIVTDLLRNELDFRGLIITDALNIMKAVTILDKAPLKASMAGCDMILMPVDEEETGEWILEEMEGNTAYRKQIHQSVKRILRLKLCLGLIDV